MHVIAYALPVPPGKESELQSVDPALDSRSGDYDALRQKIGVRREAAFLQRSPADSQLILYRELDGAPPSRLTSQMSGFVWDRSTSADPQIELLTRQRLPRQGELYAAALPLLANKVARLHEFASELNGIHAAEFEDSLRRLRIGLTLFAQSSRRASLVITVVEGDDPADALGRLASSEHPFDRWHVKQIADQTGVDLLAPPPAPNEQLWAWTRPLQHSV